MVHMMRIARALLVVAVVAAAFLIAVQPPPPRVQTDRPLEEAGRSGALEALEFWTASRSYPDADIPADAFFRAFERVRLRTAAALARTTVTPPWTSIGPVNFAGRTISVAVNPKLPTTIYVGAAAGGLWRSRSGGRSGDWQQIRTGYPVLGVNAIAIDPADTSVMYIGTGEVYNYVASVGGQVVRTTRGSYGMGILRTTDAGATWTPSLDWSYNQKRGVQAIRIHPLDSRILLAATSEGVVRTSDAGESWSSVLDVLMARDIAINPADPSLILAACGNFGSQGNGVYRSTDGGLTFAEVAGLPSFSGYPMLEMWAANPNIVYASLADSTSGSGSLWRSQDFGTSWTLLSNEAVYGVQGWYSQFVAVHPRDTNQVLRGGQSIYASADGGRSAVQLGGGWADYHNYAHHPDNPDTVYVVDDGGLWLFRYSTGIFEYLGSGLVTSQFYSGFSTSATDSLRALGQVQDHFGWMYVGGDEWPESAVDEVGWTAMDQKDDRNMFAVTRGGGGVYRSTDRGVNFFGVNSGLSGGRGAWNTPIIISTSNPQVLYFGRSVIFKSTNGGDAWSATSTAGLDGNRPLSMAMSHTGTDTVYVGTSPGTVRGHLYRTTNGGGEWMDVTGPLPDRYPMDLAVDPQNSAIVYAAMGGFNAPHLWKSIDAGTTWTDITGSLPDVPATAVIVDPSSSDHVYAGTDLGVFASTDGGTSWSPYNDGLPDAVIVADLVISPSNRVLRLASHSNGVFDRPLIPVVPVGVDEGRGSTPLAFTLYQNYPNPFNPSTVVRYQLPSESDVRITVHDLLGREVAVLVNEKQRAGGHSVSFDGSEHASGIYLCRLTAGELVRTVKMVLVR